jgi:hypothetical protein
MLHLLLHVASAVACCICYCMLYLLHATCVVHAALLRRYEERVRALESASAATSAKNADLQV